MSAHRYLVVSDLHLCDVEDHADGWKRHKSSEYVYDAELDSLVRDFLRGGNAEDRYTLVLNGDIIEFDLVTAIPDDPPWPVAVTERLHGLEATPEKSAWKLRHILADHPRFIATLVDLLAAGHRVVYVLGNHDRELHFPEVRLAFDQILQAHATERGIDLGTARVRFEPWFYYVPGEIYAEHGQQYDFYCSFRYILHPVIKTLDGSKMLALPMGNLSNRYINNRTGYFNPHAGDYLLSFFGYVTHWLHYYAFSKRGLVFVWLLGSIRTLVTLLRNKNLILQQGPKDYPERLQEVADRFGIGSEKVELLDRRKRLPITSRVYRIIREFWLDRVLMAGVMTLGTIALALSPAPLWVKLMVPLTGFPLLHFVYEWFAGGDTAVTLEQESHQVAFDIASILPVRVVTFGHTHVPNLIPLSRDVTFANTGTWAPVWGPNRRTLVPGLRNYLVVSAEGEQVETKLGSWMPLQPGAGESLAEERPRR